MISPQSPPARSLLALDDPPLAALPADRRQHSSRNAYCSNIAP
jgi:hypothetical protein